ncbi:UDP-glycosyltransferase 86A1-like [Silene latifolia]|uniref:UDP-glycosyltransferase 86A1-like n=1 Tax=Silene latifolia TaxID=37657 RepID=UPI003D770CD2
MENQHTPNKCKPHAILIALPLQGHIIPSVQLALTLASKGFSITFINTENIHHQITQSSSPSNVSMGEDADNSIFAHARQSLELDIEYLTVSDGLPIEWDRSLNHDMWVGATMYCFPAHVEMAVAKIVKSRPSVTCLIADCYSPWASKLARKYGLLHVGLWTEAAVVLDVYFHLHLLRENGHLGPGARKDEIDYIPGIKSIKPTDLTSYLQEEDLTTICHQSIFAQIDDAKKADFILSNNIQELEAQPISALQAQIPFYAIGPLFQTGPGFSKGPVATSLWAESSCLDWLDTKPLGSVLYVSFGSYAHIGKEELVAIANGIKLSGVNFLWVIRPDMVSSDEPDPLPVGFRDEVGERGMIVSWTRQTEVLSHRAVGGFLTHCGWNSTLESIHCEVPLLCFPLLTDQFTNRKLIVEDWGVGCNLCDERPVTEKEVSRKVQDLMGGSMGCKLKSKMKQVKEVVDNAMAKGGSSQRNVDTFVDNLKVAWDARLAS